MGFHCPEHGCEELESCEQLDGARAFRLTAALKLCATINAKGTGCLVTSEEVTFRAKDVGYELRFKWPQPIDESRATKSFSKKDRVLTVLAPVL